MAGNRLSFSVAGVTISTGFKTVLEVQAPTNHGMIVETIEFAGLSSSTTEKIEYEVVAGASGGTPGSSVTAVAKTADYGDETHGAGGQSGYSAEPSGGRIIKRGTINGLGGDRFGVGIRLNPGEKMGLRCKATGSNTITSTIHTEV